MRRAVILWVGAGLLLGLNIFAGAMANLAIIRVSLALMGAFAPFGIALGVWAAWEVTRPVPARIR